MIDSLIRAKINYEEVYGNPPDIVFMSKKFHHNMMRDIDMPYAIEPFMENANGRVLGIEFHIVDDFKGDFIFFEKSDLYGLSPQQFDMRLVKEVSRLKFTGNGDKAEFVSRAAPLKIPCILVDFFKQVVEK